MGSGAMCLTKRLDFQGKDRRAPLSLSIFMHTSLPDAGSARMVPVKYHGNMLTIATANVTAWNSFRDSGLVQQMGADVWCIQEHKLTTRAQVSRERTWLKQQNMHSSFGRAKITAKGGASAGTAVIWAQGLGTVSGASFRDGGPWL